MIIMEKCDSCGESLASFLTICPTCGAEISKIDGNSKLAELELKINEVRKAFKDKISEATDAGEKVLVESERDKEIETLISNFTIPTDKENLLEFLAHCECQQQNMRFAQAYRVKLNECISKLEILAISDHSVNVVLSQLSLKNLFNTSNAV